MIIIVSMRTPINAIIAEYVIDNLNLTGPKAMVARMVMSGLGLEELDEISQRLAEKFGDIGMVSSRKSVLTSMVCDVKKMLDKFIDDNSEMIADDLGIDAEGVKQACLRQKK